MSEPERYYWRPAEPPKVADPRAHTPEHMARLKARFERAVSADCEASRLLPCPKCGNRIGVRLVVYRDHRGKRSRKQNGRCDKAGGGCGLESPVQWSATDAERAWNDPEWREGGEGVGVSRGLNHSEVDRISQGSALMSEGITSANVIAAKQVDARGCRDRAEFFRDLARRLERSHPGDAKRYAEGAHHQEVSAACLDGTRRFMSDADLAELREEVGRG